MSWRQRLTGQVECQVDQPLHLIYPLKRAHGKEVCKIPCHVGSGFGIQDIGIVMRLEKRLKKLTQRLPWRWSGDVIYLISFPKCGRTWLRLLIGHYLAHHYGLPTDNYLRIQDYHRLDRRVPLIEKLHDDKPQKRRLEELGRSKDLFCRDKVIFLVRDPRDVLVSWFYARKYRESGPKYAGTIHDFITEEYGSLAVIVEYYNIWFAERDKPKSFLLLRYEELHAGPEQELKRVLGFLGVPQIDDALVTAAAAFASFDNMRQLEEQDAFNMRTLRPENKDDERSYKTRKGIVGDHKNTLTEVDLAFVDTYVKEHLNPELGYCGNQVV